MIDEALLSRAREAAEVVAPLASRIEKERALPREAIDALVRSRVFKVVVPAAFAGEEAHPATMTAMIEAIARGDGSAGWCAMVGATSGLMSRFLEEPLAREVFGAEDAITCGVFAPMGRATPTDDGRGYVVSGRWPFASGCEHASWRMGGAFAADRPGDVVSVLFRASETRIHDTWDTSGLRGTGSHDIEAVDVVVPRERTFSLLRDRPLHGREPLPFFGVLASGVAAVGLGIARAALDAFIEIAKTKTPPGAKRTLAHRETTQLEVARAEARLGAARALLYSAVEASAAHADDRERRARLRLAACHVATECADVVTAMFRGAGGSAVYTKHPLQRHLRDAHVVTQHIMVAEPAATTAGKVLLGLDVDTSML